MFETTKRRVAWNKGLPSPFKGLKRDPQIGRKISQSKLGKKRPPFSEEWKRNIGLGLSGSKNYQWIEDRTKLKNYNQRPGNYEYIKWRKLVRERDGHKCKLEGTDCNGRIEVHHIYNWRKYPELRFEIDNGITLCRRHHPIGAKEELAIPLFKSLINSKL